MKNTLLIGCCALLSLTGLRAQDSWNPAEEAVIRSTRPDGRLGSSYAIAHQLMKDLKPRLAFRPDFTREEMVNWQREVAKAMKTLMSFPDYQPEQAPICISRQPRDGYVLEKWEFYPLPKAVCTFLVLRPDSIEKPTPAVFCIPGANMSKEGLAGEPGIVPLLNDNYQSDRVAMARSFAKRGYIAVAVDNPAAGESSDLEKYDRGRDFDYDVVSRMLLEIGWSYLGYAAFLDKQVLDWMKQEPYIDAKRILVSGFSLGTEPLMVLGVLDPSIYGFIYNDFLCQTQERACVMTYPMADGRRPFPNSIRHLIPNFWKYFNFPDLVAALAPRPLLLTEGGLDRDFELVQRAYELSGHPSQVEMHHYAKFADPTVRHQLDSLPEGLDRDSYFKLVNVDPANHYYKNEWVFPWLEKIGFGKKEQLQK